MFRSWKQNASSGETSKANIRTNNTSSLINSSSKTPESNSTRSYSFWFFKTSLCGKKTYLDYTFEKNLLIDSKYVFPLVPVGVRAYGRDVCSCPNVSLCFIYFLCKPVHYKRSGHPGLVERCQWCGQLTMGNLIKLDCFCSKLKKKSRTSFNQTSVTCL